MEALAASETPTPTTGRRLTILGRIVAIEALVLLSTPFWQPRPIALVLGAVLALALGLAWWRSAVTRLRVSWLGPDHAIAGEETALSLQARAEGVCPPCILDTPTGMRGGRQVVARLGDLDDRGLRIVWETRLGRRGWQPLPVLDAVCTLPFGLVEHRRQVSEAQDILVLPGRGLLTRELRRRLDPWIEQVATGTDPGDEELARLRPYRPGDPPRRVHWRASARARTLLISERHAPTARHIALVIDTDAARLSARRMDRLAAIAASFVDHLIRRGWQVTLHGRFAPQGITGDRRLLLEALALVETQGADEDLATCIPRGRAALVIAADALVVEQRHPQPLVLTLAECETLVRLPRRLGL